MKLLNTRVYLLLIDEEAEIKNNDYILGGADDESLNEIWVMDNHHVSDEDRKIIGYYPLTKEAKELDLPLLPNPYKKEVDLNTLAMESIIEFPLITDNPLEPRIRSDMWKEGYKAAQSKQFSLKDMQKAIVFGYGMCRNNDRAPFNLEIKEFIQSLSTQQLPKEFIIKDMEYLSANGSWKNVRLPLLEDFAKTAKLRYKTITNSEGKEELVGTYKY